MSSGIYSDLKMAWWYATDGGVTKTPKQAQVILSDLCNQNCGFCAYRMDGYSSNELFMAGSEAAKYGHNNPKRWVATDRALALIDELEATGVLAVQFTGGGEPTVHPEHERIFAHALDKGLRCALVSNGLRWSDSLIAMLPQFSWVRVSVDAGNAETYARIRETPAGNFAKVWNNVSRLAHAIRSGVPSPCVLGIGYVVTPDNWREIGEGVRLARESGAAYIRLSAMFNPDGAKPYESIYQQVKEAIHAARQANDCETFRVHDLFGERIDDLEQGRPDYKTCYYQSYTTYIGGDMNLYRCCVLAYNRRGMITSLKDKTFSEAWKLARKDFETFNARSCDRCQFNGRNRAMNYTLGEKPPHADFP